MTPVADICSLACDAARGASVTAKHDDPITLHVGESPLDEYVRNEDEERTAHLESRGWHATVSGADGFWMVPPSRQCDDSECRQCR